MGRFKDVSIPLIDHRFLEVFVPRHLRGSGAYDELRARLLGLSYLALWIWAPIFLCVQLIAGNYAHAGICAAATLTIVVMPITLRATGSLAVAAHVMSAMFFATLVFFAVYTGGLESPAMVWMLAVSLPVAIFDSPRSAWVWVGLVVATASLLWWFEGARHELIADLPEDYLHGMWLLSLAGATMMTYQVFAIYTELERWMVDEVRRQEAERRRTESKLARAQKAALEKTQRGLRTLIERSPDGIVVARDGRVVATNPAFRAMLDYQHGALEGSMLASLVAAEARGELVGLTDDIASGDAVAYREFDFLRREGSTCVAEATGFVGVYNSQPATYLVLRDVTQRKQAQSREMQLDRMKAVGTLAAGVAHEINNPLAYVHSNIEFLLGQTAKYRGEDATSVGVLGLEDVAEALEDIREGTDRIRSIVADLSTFSKTSEESRRPLDLAEILESSLRMADNQLRHRARVRTDFAQVPAVDANEANLAQVFLNLLVNAAHAIPEGAADQNEVVVRLFHDEADDRVVVEVSDTGTGISKEAQARIFDPFFSTKGQDEGMGLGLSICRNIVNDYGGDIGFESVAGDGTTFRVGFPAVAREAESSREFSAPTLVDGHLGRALIIDDEVRVCRMVDRLLSRSYDTRVANSGREALDLLDDDNQFDVVVCDLLMPDVTGVELYAQLVERFPRLAEHTVFITGGTFTETTSAFVANTDRPVIVKPFDLMDFRDVVDRTATAA